MVQGQLRLIWWFYNQLKTHVPTVRKHFLSGVQGTQVRIKHNFVLLSDAQFADFCDRVVCWYITFQHLPGYFGGITANFGTFWLISQ